MKKAFLITFIIYFFVNLNAQDITETSILRSSDYASGDMFGINVSISGDYFISGAREEDEDENGLNTVSNAGSAYLYFGNATGVDFDRNITFQEFR